MQAPVCKQTVTKIDCVAICSKDPHVVAGALLGVGVINSSVADENDPAFALLFEPISSSDPVIRSGAILGLALAYAGTGKMEVCCRPSSPITLYMYQTCKRMEHSWVAALMSERLDW